MKNYYRLIIPLLALLSFGFAQTELPFLIPSSVPQKLADAPKDKPIRIQTNSAVPLCYIPQFSLGAEHNSYLGILNCAVPEAKPARYDVFGRLAFNINKTWVCITAPSSVADSKREWDYLFLSPCVINDTKQQWKIKDGSFWSLDDFYSIKDDGDYLYAVWFKDTHFNKHTLDSSMQDWQNTLATPPTLSIVMSLAWDLMTTEGNQRYFLQNDTSEKNTMPLYYNLESGHIAQYNPLVPELNCLYSHLDSTKDEWDWAVWATCNDTKPPKNNRAFWNPILIGDKQIALQDIDGNLLRLTRYGIHWGVPYIATNNYLTKDTANSPTSIFSIPQDMQDWLRFIAANIGKNLHSCPAKGHRALAQNAQPLPLLKQFPPNFRMTPQWEQRLFNIIRTHDGSGESIGVCGVCLLQSFQIIAELLENPYHPRTSGGYFFDAIPNTNPFDTFIAHNSILYATFRDISRYYTRPLVVSQDIFLQTMDRVFAGTISMLPQYNWQRAGTATREEQMEPLLQHIFNAPAGTIFIVSLVRLIPGQARSDGHALVAIRTQDGVIVIPTNARAMSLENFRIRTAPVHNTSDLRMRLSQRGATFTRIVGLDLIEMRQAYNNPFEQIISVANCTGEGDDRRGSGRFPTAVLINQCGSGARCE